MSLERLECVENIPVGLPVLDLSVLQKQFLQGNLLPLENFGETALLHKNICDQIKKLHRPLVDPWVKENGSILRKSNNGIVREEILCQGDRAFVSWVGTLEDGSKKILMVWRQYIFEGDKIIGEEPFSLIRKYEGKVDYLRQAGIDDVITIKQVSKIKENRTDKPQIVLVDPKYYQNEEAQGYENKGSLVAVSKLVEKGYPVTVLPFGSESTTKNYDDFQKKERDFINYVCQYVIDHNVKYVGIPVINVTLTRVLRVVRAIKQINPNIKIILGGPGVTGLSIGEHLVSTSVSSFFELSYNSKTNKSDIDVVVKNEGPDAFLETVEAFENHQKITSKGTEWFDSDHQTVWINPSRSSSGKLLIPQDAMEKIQFDAKLAAGYSPNIGGLIPHVGCKHGCVYCLGRTLNGGLYADNNITIVSRSPEEVVGDLIKLIEKGAENIFLHSPTVHGYKEWDKVAEFMQKARKSWKNDHKDAEMPDFQLTAFARMDDLEDQDLFDSISSIKPAKLTLSIGYESADIDILKEVKKGGRIRTIQEQKEILIKLKNQGVAIRLSIIIGLPNETEEQARKTINLVAGWKQKGIIASVEIHNLDMPYNTLAYWLTNKNLGSSIPKYLLEMGNLDMPQGVLQDFYSKHMLNIGEYGTAEQHAMSNLARAGILFIDSHANYGESKIDVSKVFELIQWGSQLCGSGRIAEMMQKQISSLKT